MKVLLLAMVCALGCMARGDDDAIVLWHSYNGSERTALEQAVRDSGVSIRLVQVPYDAFADKITNAIPNGNGPDLFIFAHDRLGDWVSSGLLESISFFVDETQAAEYADTPLHAMAYKEQLYGLPVAVKSVALYYRTDLVDPPPATSDALFALCATRQAQKGYALAYDNVDLYFHAGFLHGHGGAIFDDAGKLAIATPEAAQAGAFARRLHEDRCVPPDVDAPLVATLFNEGVAALVLSGPWFAADIGKDVPWRVAALPTIDGRPAAPFLGAEGVWMSSRSKRKAAAFAAMRAVAGTSSAIVRARLARQIVPNLAAYHDAQVAADPVLSAFKDHMSSAQPMPATPEMRMVWQPYRRALERIINEGVDPMRALTDAEAEIAGYIARARANDRE